MVRKHLVRHRLVGLTEEFEYDRIVEKNRQLVDEVLSDYFPAHTLEITPSEMKETGISPYERDNMNELGNALFVMPHLTRSLKQKVLRKPKTSLEELFSEIGYEKYVIRSDNTSYDGGRFIIGENFGLISSSIISHPRLKKAIGLNIPLYRVSQVSTLFSPGIYHDYGDHVQLDLSANRHIDSRYNILDAARIIYVAMGARPGTMEEGPNEFKQQSFEELQKAAKEYGYEIRDYFVEKEKFDEKLQDSEYLSVGEKFGFDWTSGHLINGINFITSGNYLFTSIIGYGEKQYLQNKGITVVEVPLKISYNGAGLRCLYGELTI